MNYFNLNGLLVNSRPNWVAKYGTQFMDQLKAIHLAQKNKLAGINFLIKSHSRWLLGLIHGIDFNIDAEDIAQDVWLLVWQKISTLKEPEKFKPWLRTITVRHVIKVRQKTEPLISETSIEEVISDKMSEIDEKISNISELKRALSLLPDEQRVAYVLSQLEGMTTSEIANTMNVPEGTVKSRINAARRKFACMLDKNETAEKEVINV